MNAYYVSLVCLCAIIYVVFQDPNVPQYLDLRIKLLRIDITRYFMKIKMKRQLDRDYKNMQKLMKEWMKNNGEDKM